MHPKKLVVFSSKLPTGALSRMSANFDASDEVQVASVALGSLL